jgi:hypothetical protein
MIELLTRQAWECQSALEKLVGILDERQGVPPITGAKASAELGNVLLRLRRTLELSWGAESYSPDRRSGRHARHQPPAPTAGTVKAEPSAN